jgi:hypothetical protein
MKLEDYNIVPGCDFTFTAVFIRRDEFGADKEYAILVKKEGRRSGKNCMLPYGRRKLTEKGLASAKKEAYEYNRPIANGELF